MIKKNRKGFTLVEMVVVIAIIGILAAILIPALTGYIGKANKDKSKAEAEAAWLEYTNGCKNNGLTPSSTFVFKTQDGTYYEVNSEGIASVTDRRDVTDLSTCNGGISYEDPSSNSSEGGGGGGSSSSLTNQEIIDRRTDLNGIYRYEAQTGSLKFGEDNPHKDINSVRFLKGELRKTVDREADKSPKKEQEMGFNYDVSHYKDDDLTFEINTAATSSYNVTYYDETNTAVANPTSIQIGEKGSDIIRKIELESTLYYKQIHYAIIELGLMEGDSAQIKAEMVDEIGNIKPITTTRTIKSNGVFQKVLLSTDDEEMPGKVRITINKSRDMYSPIFIKSIEISSKKYTTGSFTGEIDDEEYIELRNSNLEASQASKGTKVEVIGTVTFIDVGFLSGSANLFYVQTKDAAMAVQTTKECPQVGSYVKMGGKVAGFEFSEAGVSNLLSGTVSVTCSDYKSISMSNGPEVIPIVLDNIDFDFNSKVIPTNEAEKIKIGEFTIGENKYDHYLLDYALVEAEELTVVEEYHAEKILNGTTHYELTAKNSKGQLIPFYINRSVPFPTDDDRYETLTSLKENDKFLFSGGVLFSNKKKNKTYVKLSMYDSKIKKIIID